MSIRLYVIGTQYNGCTLAQEVHPGLNVATQLPCVPNTGSTVAHLPKAFSYSCNRELTFQLSDKSCVFCIAQG